MRRSRYCSGGVALLDEPLLVPLSPASLPALWGFFVRAARNQQRGLGVEPAGFVLRKIGRPLLWHIMTN